MEQKHKREEIAIIGGGRGGVETALMMAKQTNKDNSPKYHVTLIEEQDTLLNGASMIASRLHLGGEYPLDPQTAKDCLEGAIIFKLLMPDNIYTPTPPMKFLVSEKTQGSGEMPENQYDSKSLTLQKYEQAYEKIAHDYSLALTELQKKLKLPKVDDAAKLLFGPKADLFKRLDPSSDPKKGYGDYNQGDTKIAGGFQSKEPGINIGKFLAMLHQELELQQQKGNITILTGHQVIKDGIQGDLGSYKIHCKTKDGAKIIPSSQVILTAWQRGPQIIPHLDVDEQGNEKHITVFKRAMMLVDLPTGWKTPPAFIMLGESGGMLSPYNDKTAICYLPTKEAAYRKNHLLTDSQPSLPADWDKITDEEKEKWTQKYFTLLKERFPILEGATNPRLIIRDTISFQPDLDQRNHEAVAEVGKRMQMKMQQTPKMEMQQAEKMSLEMLQEIGHYQPPGEITGRPGLFTLYPTKATYSLRAAIQATEMVMERSASPSKESIVPSEHTLGFVLERDRQKYSLANMQEPNPRFLHDFCKAHPDLFGPNEKPDLKIMSESWPKDSQTLATQVQKAAGQFSRS